MVNPQPPYLNYSDLELLALAKKDDFPAFDEIYRRYRNNLLQLAYKKLPSRYMAEDIVQDIFISLYQKRATLEITATLGGYLVRALQYKIANEIRADIIRSRYQKFLFFNSFCKNDFSSRVETNELYSRVDSTIRKLPPKCKEAFLLSRREEQSHKDISTTLKISVSTVEKHIVKALKIMRSSLDDYMITN